MFTIGNATLVAIMQIGLIVAGVLASGLWHKFAIDSQMEMPFPASVLFNYGTIGFVIPLTWIVCALFLRSRNEVSDDVKRLAFGLGILVLIALGGFVIYADVSPCFSIMWSLSGGGDG